MERRPLPEEGIFFDERASLRMFAEDIAAYEGQVRPETRQQVANEELTFVAEAMNAPLKTTFTLEMTEKGLVNEQGKLFRRTLENGRRAAANRAQQKPNFECVARRAVYEKHEGDLVEAMMTSDEGHNTIVSVSPFAEEAYRKFGAEGVKEMGFRPDRFVAFIRIYNKKSPTELEVISVSVDNSDLDAFRGLLAQNGLQVEADATSDDFLKYRLQLDLSRHEQLQLPTKLVRTYDGWMEKMHGTKTKAGRSVENEIEAWEFINSQPDLVEHYLDRLEALARIYPDDVASKRKLAVGFWSALNQRLKRSQPGQLYEAHIPERDINQLMALDAEIHRGFRYAVEYRLQMVGCGGLIEAIGGDKDLLEGSAEDAISKVFDNKEASYKFDKMMHCLVCQAPPKEGDQKKACGPCGICRPCDTKLKVKAK